MMKKFTVDGVLVDSIIGLLSGGWGLTYGDGYLWASDPDNDIICKIATVTGVEDENKYAFEKFHLFQNYPNPFRQFTTISYSIPRLTDGRWQSAVNLNIYDLNGRVVRTLVNRLQPGYYEVIWDGTNEAGLLVAPGIYFYSLKSKDFDITKKMIIIR
jgi:hypothetical protein